MLPIARYDLRDEGAGQIDLKQNILAFSLPSEETANSNVFHDRDGVDFFEKARRQRAQRLRRGKLLDPDIWFVAQARL